jgi:hypothetical protein
MFFSLEKFRMLPCLYITMKLHTNLLCLFATLLASTSLIAQNNDNYIYWSANRKLTAADFAIKTSDGKAGTIAAQYYFSYEVNSFDFMTKNFNKKVHNCIIRSASWIDTTYDVKASLRYQQTLFDLAEVYARHFRQDLKENRKKLAKGTEFVKELSTKAMTDFAKREVEYVSETQFGTNPVMQERWEGIIKMELDALKDFAANDERQR